MKKWIFITVLTLVCKQGSAQKSGDLRLGLSIDPFEFRGIGPSMRYYIAKGVALQGDFILNAFSDNINFHGGMVVPMPSELDPKKMSPYMGAGFNIVYNTSFLTLFPRPNGDWVKAAPYINVLLGMDMPAGKTGLVIHGEWRPKMLLMSPTLRQAGFNRIVIFEMGLGIRYQFNQGTLKKS
jgi:hypothetical protein